MQKRLLFIFSLTVFYSLAQKKVINHEVYNDWKSIKAEQISSNGKLVSYEINPHQGDGKLYLLENDQTRLTINRGKKAAFNHAETVFHFLIDPGYDTLRKLELDKVKKEKWVKDTLAIYLVEKDTLITYDNIVSYKYSEMGDWLAFLQPSPKEEPAKTPWWRIFKKKNKKEEEEEKPEAKGKQLTVLHPLKNEKKVFESVTEYSFDRTGETLLIVSHYTFNDKDSVTVHLYNTTTGETKSSEQVHTAFGNYSYDFNGSQLAYLASNDTVKKNKLFDLYHWKVAQDQPTVLVDTVRNDLPEGQTVSNFRTPYFSRNGERLYVGIKELAQQEEKDTLLEREKAKLDLWHYQDQQLQPRQLKQKKQEEKSTLLSVIHLNENKLVVLEDEHLKVRISKHGNSDYALGVNNKKYESNYDWSYPWLSDYYRVDLRSGEAQLLKDSLAYVDGLSPSGKYFVYFDNTTENYKMLDISTQETHCITCSNTTAIWTRDVNGMPHEPRPYGSPGYTENEQSLLLYSRHDIWEVKLSSNKIQSITDNRLRDSFQLRLRTWDTDSIFIDLARTWVHGIDQQTKDEHIFQLDYPTKELKTLLQTPHKITSIKKSPQGDKVIFRKMNVRDYPDVYLSSIHFDNPTKLSTANPQQEEYIWPNVEMIRWETKSGKKLEGLVYTPEDFDSTKSYPLLVYFYELYGDRKHQHYIPKPTASIIYATEYTSAGYVVFIPDIRYDTGYPARSAYECIMSGTDEVLAKLPNIDSTRMGLQGQSWGGYQTAQLITMTNRYKAAMAGAPVSNMFSAYGGIRWGSGLNRQFQYEHSQSRIGKTIWEAPELYVENSPIFGVPNIETPLLIMHNDNDGAVPWYQGIEMFVGMKRLGKPVWMLNYNGDEHNLMKNANRMDLSIRMRQFFDHYLLGEPAPKWLIEGIPALEKGRDYRLELEIIE